MTRRTDLSAPLVQSTLAITALTLATCRDVHEPTPPPMVGHPALPLSNPRSLASGEFRGLWYDGNAELAGYEITQPRYGSLRHGELALIYVTEPLDRQTWIKRDDALPERRVDVLKLNANLTFLAGIYPYSVMTSVFSPIDDWGMARFTPVKITLTAQEWCGQVFEGMWPGVGTLERQTISYFADEGERHLREPVPDDTLYEDALLIQLRELDGPFAKGASWSGYLVPSLWRLRRAHTPAVAAPTTITRSEAMRDGFAVTRFVVESTNYRRTIDVERAAPRRILGWQTSDGEQATLRRSTRLPYWERNRPGDESLREQLGFPTQPAPAPTPPPGTTTIGR